MTRETLKYTDRKGLRVFAKTFINHRESHVHEIKNIVISKQYDFYAVINKDTLCINDFETEKEALDFVLDFFKFLGHNQEKIEY